MCVSIGVDALAGEKRDLTSMTVEQKRSGIVHKLLLWGFISISVQIDAKTISENKTTQNDFEFN